MPTALERTGDFSKSVTTASALIVVKDPTTGICIPGKCNSQEHIRSDRRWTDDSELFPPAELFPGGRQPEFQ